MKLTAPELMHAEIGARQFAVRDLVPLGSVTVLSAKKGRGKSVATLTMADAVSRGRPFLGRPTKAGNVLYIGTEDDDVELRGRYERLLATIGEEASPDLDIADRWPTVAEGGIDELRRWCQSVAKPRLIVVDIAALLAPELLIVRRGWTAVLEALMPWLKLAREEQVAVILVVHSYRGPDIVPNPIEAVQGSGGLTAYSQTVLVIQGKEGSTDRQLAYRGKFGTGELPLTIDGKTMTCELRGADPAEVEAQNLRAALLRVVRQHPGKPARDVAMILARAMPGYTVDSTVRMLQLMLQEGQLRLVDRRLYVNATAEEGEQLGFADPQLIA